MKASSESGECASVISITLVAACLVGMGGTRKTEWRSSVNHSKKTQVPGSALSWECTRTGAERSTKSRIVGTGRSHAQESSTLDPFAQFAPRRRSEELLSQERPKGKCKTQNQEFKMQEPEEEWQVIERGVHRGHAEWRNQIGQACRNKNGGDKGVAACSARFSKRLRPAGVSSNGFSRATWVAVRAGATCGINLRAQKPGLIPSSSMFLAELLSSRVNHSQCRHQPCHGPIKIGFAIEVGLPIPLQHPLIVLPSAGLEVELISVGRVVAARPSIRDAQIFCQSALDDFAGGVKQEGMPEVAGNRFPPLAAFADDGVTHRAGHCA